MSVKHWGIVGGGFLGMTLALRLAQKGHKVTLLESSSTLGGLADAWQVDDFTWDRHYHVILLSDYRLRGILRELNLEQELQWVETKTGFYTDDKLYSMSNSLEFLKFPPLRMIDKARLASTILYASKLKDWKRLESIPVTDWLKKWSGSRTFEKIWLPLLRAKLGENYKIASASFIWAIIARMYAARDSGLKKELFGYIQGGYAKIIEAFQNLLEQNNVEIILNAKVQSVESKEGKVRVTSSDRELTFDQVVMTMASPIVSKICPSLSSKEHQQLQEIEYQGILCPSVVLKKPLAGYYVTNITDDWVPFTAVIEMSALVDPKEFGQKSLVYLPKYIPSNSPELQTSDEDLEQVFIDALLRMYPSLKRDDILAFKVSRVKYVLAIATLHYSKNLFPMHTSQKGIHIVNSAHILNGTLNVNETIQLAEKAVISLLQQ